MAFSLTCVAPLSLIAHGVAPAVKPRVATVEMNISPKQAFAASILAATVALAPMQAAFASVLDTNTEILAGRSGGRVGGRAPMRAAPRAAPRGGGGYGGGRTSVYVAPMPVRTL